MKKIILLILSISLILNLVQAQEIRITKETNQDIELNDVIEVKINILNSYNTEKVFEISERLPNNIELIEPNKPDEVKKYNGIEANFLKWNLIISPNKISTLNYKIKIKYLGEYSIQPTTITDINNDNTFFSNSLEFNVKCTPNNACETDENYLNCPEDCSQSISDGICNYALDNMCDPDCLEDPDCKKTNLFNIILFSLILIILIIIFYFIFKKKDQVYNNLQ